MTLRITAVDAPPGALHELRLEVREFLRREIAAGGFEPEADAWMSGVDPAFSRRLAGRGWVGMTVPARYGGHGRSALERYVVTEELLVAGAPVAAHWIADRQMAPGILRNGSEEQKHRYLPGIVRAEQFMAIGMSEPDSGSDLASVRTRAVEVDGGWRLTGTKVWTSVAHIATAIVVLARTDEGGDRHSGLSQFIVDLPHPAVTISPIITIDGAHHFNEVVFDDAVVPQSALLGRRGDGWRQVTAELGNERSGPERFLSALPLLLAWTRTGAFADDPLARADLGRLVSRLTALRQLSLAVAERLSAGENPAVEAALVKDLGTAFEGEMVDVVRRHVDPASGAVPEQLAAMLAKAVLHVPAFTLRGGTNEVLRSIVAKGLTGR
ncbi:hypothetical protein SAMN04489712_1429 [Thermomonospora echinospora]|uniref:Acyl-CoA dehydrogenase n=1 Tax=Thermomonospora echinospora TaxID=1992 RepID=A0A1H6EA31_9ACTN|nr:acyl-CoA dehydrogenase family protein [Thermomonospora echinospora]SEG93959.1 hypothetical protein SAMN04489712_1429 [Thermomonospora echinospora]